MQVQPKLLTWARERAGYEQKELEGKFHKLAAWEAGTLEPTMKQLEKFSHAVHVPFGYLMLKEPPVEEFPIADLRSEGGSTVRKPSVNLLDTIYMCQTRQGWYHDHAKKNEEQSLDFVGSSTTDEEPALIAKEIRETIGFSLNDQKMSDF